MHIRHTMYNEISKIIHQDVNILDFSMPGCLQTDNTDILIRYKKFSTTNISPGFKVSTLGCYWELICSFSFHPSWEDCHLSQHNANWERWTLHHCTPRSPFSEGYSGPEISPQYVFTCLPFAVTGGTPQWPRECVDRRTGRRGEFGQ